MELYNINLNYYKPYLFSLCLYSFCVTKEGIKKGIRFIHSFIHE
ncbi:hypothetical protein pb186bvf_002122 [Paramecium bursaria]